MKKIFKFSLCVFTLIILLSGCSFNVSVNSGSKDEVKVEMSYNSSAAEEVIVDVENEDIVSISTESPDEYKCKGVDGCSFTTYYVIKPKKEGTTKVTFTKQRFTDNTLLRKEVYDIKVDKDLKITETHKVEK